MRYVIIGYLLTYGTLVAYVISLVVRIRSAKTKVEGL